jgi:F0F1-type ATP synthase assembly protein I
MQSGPEEPTRETRPTAHRRADSSTSSGAEYAGVGLQLGMTFVMFALAGYWLDRKLGTSPWLLIVMVVVGFAAGFYSVYQRVIGSGRAKGGGR